jgi:hypothetical protein
MKKSESYISVRRAYSEVKNRKSQEVYSDESDMIEVKTFDDVPTATVSVRGGMTKNLGSYNSATVQISVTVPTYLEELDEAAAFAMNKVEEYLTPSLDEFTELLQSKGLLK